MLPVPWYFNHKMWLDMAGLETVPLPCGDGMLPDPDAARARMTPRVKAIVLVTPNNPTGAEYPPDLVAEFAEIARAHGAVLILDETYRDFLSRDGRRTSSSPTPTGATTSSTSTRSRSRSA